MKTRGRQQWLKAAIDQHPQLLLRAFQRAKVIGRDLTLSWQSPVKADGFKEYRDQAALKRAGLPHLATAFKAFWPARGPAWDGIATASDGTPIFIDATAPIPSAASPAARIAPDSRSPIQRSLQATRRVYASRAGAAWGGVFDRYTSRLAHQYFLRELTGVQSALVFLHFAHAKDANGPRSEAEWKAAIRRIHAELGLRSDMKKFGVYEVFVDVREIEHADGRSS